MENLFCIHRPKKSPLRLFWYLGHLLMNALYQLRHMPRWSPTKQLMALQAACAASTASSLQNPCWYSAHFPFVVKTKILSGFLSKNTYVGEMRECELSKKQGILYFCPRRVLFNLLFEIWKSGFGTLAKVRMIWDTYLGKGGAGPTCGSARLSRVDLKPPSENSLCLEQDLPLQSTSVLSFVCVSL